MGTVYHGKKNDIIIHLKPTDVKKLTIVRVENSDKRNYYAEYDVIHGNNICVPHEFAMEVIDLVKEGRIIDIYHSYFKDKDVFFQED